MGKRGKERKKRKLSPGISQVEESPSENESENDHSAPTESEVAISASVLEAYYWNHRETYLSKTTKGLRKILFPLIDVQIKARAHFEITPPLSKSVPLDEPSTKDLVTLRRVALYYQGENGRCQFGSVAGRPFRRALHPFVLMQQGTSQISEEDRSFSGRVSNAFRSRNWELALSLLFEMSQSAEPLKLGALQRWVRDCDFASSLCDSDAAVGENEKNAMKNTALLLLDAVMRVGEMSLQTPDDQVNDRGPGQKTTNIFMRPPALSVVAQIKRFEPFWVPPVTGCEQPDSSDITESCALPTFTVVHTVPGVDRKPPSPHALNIYSTAPGTIFFSDISTSAAHRRRLDVPGVPGAFLMTNILSTRECTRIVQVAEAIGFKPDAVDNIDNIVWLADESFWNPIFSRCLPMMPAQIGGHKLMGINARFRLFRYYPGAVYRPHIDGAWPGSGLDADGRYTDDAYDGARYSKLTFLVYLNDVSPTPGHGDVPNCGGATTFFLPSRERGFGHIEARCVVPREGHVLCFPHGDAVGSLVHEGSEVENGAVKYIIRSDVLYSTN